MKPGILGLWDGHEASVAVVAEGRLGFALSEERVSRRKRHSGFPHLALARALNWADERGVTIIDVALAGRYGRALLRVLEPWYSRSDPHRDPLDPRGLAAQCYENRVAATPGLREIERIAGTVVLRARLERQLGRAVRVHTVPHHDAHAFSALLGPRLPDAAVVTWDAYGEGLAATVRSAAEPHAVESSLGPDAGLASLYGAVTVALGFDEGDEGKLMALAASGDAGRAGPRFRALFRPGASPRLLRPLCHGQVRELLHGLSREDVAAALQQVVEALAQDWITSSAGDRPLLLAGGLFANIKLNAALAARPGARGLYVFPAMTDSGLSAGAAHCLWYERSGALAEPCGLPMLGCSFDRGANERALRDAGLTWRRLRDPGTALARRIVAGKVVGRFAGRDEFGPRALGNRSILFSAAQPDLATRVNRALGRDGFMPFGPVVAAERAADLWEAMDADLSSMTVAVRAGPVLRERCPAAVHGDGTTRPQVVARETSPGLHAVMRAVERLGHGPAMINTSFNRHGEPIVHSPSDAIQAFRGAGLDALLLDDLLVEADRALA